jgi:hypothetical protein
MGYTSTTLDLGERTLDNDSQGGFGHGGHNFEPDGGAGGQCSVDDSVLLEIHGNYCYFT